VILGTAAYMAPEQARGLPVDKRADIWAFGVILFEMLSGRSAFAAGTVPDTLAAVLTREIEWEVLPASTPTAIRRLLRHCLERDPKNRLHDIADARIVLAEPAGELRDVAALPPVTARRRFRALGLGLLALAAALGTMAVWLTSRSASPAATPVVGTLPPPPGTSYYFGTIGPGPATLSRDAAPGFAAVDRLVVSSTCAGWLPASSASCQDRAHSTRSGPKTVAGSATSQARGEPAQACCGRRRTHHGLPRR
jgi:hypothetical protein